MPAYLTSPAQRLASTVRPGRAHTSTVRLGRAHTTQTAAAGTGDYKADIMNITEAILHLCNGSSVHAPPLVKDAWHVDDENDDENDDMDDDSGIDRSEDFAQEILNDI